MATGLMYHLDIYVSNLAKSKEFWDWFLIAPEAVN